MNHKSHATPATLLLGADGYPKTVVGKLREGRV